MSDLLVSDGYCISYLKRENRIVIVLPPTAQTPNNTFDKPVIRKTDISDEDAILLLEMVKYIFKEAET